MLKFSRFKILKIVNYAFIYDYQQQGNQLKLFYERF